MSRPGASWRGARPGRGSESGHAPASTTGSGLARSFATASSAATRSGMDTARSASEWSIW